jgi:PAS domain S-box-containing protein
MSRQARPTGRDQNALAADVISAISAVDAASEGAIALWLPRFLETACDRLSLSGSALVITAGPDTRVVARHGIEPAVLAEVLERCAGAPAAHAKAGSDGQARPSQPQSVEHCTAAIGGRFYTAVSIAVPDSRRAIMAFAAGRGPGESDIDTFRSVALHVGRLVAEAMLKQQLGAANTNLERMAGELKEMQVCSLNMMEDLQRKNRDLSMVNTLSQQITSCTSLPELARVAAEAISDAFDGACVSLHLANQGRTAFMPYHTTGTIGGDGDGLGVPVGSDLAAAISKGQDVALDSTGPATEFPLARAVSAKSTLIVPLRSKAATLGFLAVCEARWHRVFTDDERENLRALAGTLSVAIENANLMSRTADQIEEMNLLTEYIETVVDSVDLAVMVVGADLKIGMINKGFERVFNQAREQFIGRHILEAFPHLEDQGFETIVAQVLQGAPFVKFGWRRKPSSGREIVQNIRIFPHRAAGGSIVGAIVMIEDVTEKADLEVQLARSEAKFQGLVEDLEDGYLIVTGGKIVYANKAATQMVSISASDLLGADINRILPDGQTLSECLNPSAGKARRQSRLIHAAGTWIPVEVSLSRCEYGGSQSVSMVLRDITERRKFEKQLEVKNKETAVRAEQITRLNLELEATVNKLNESQENLIKSERLAAITETSVAANHEINNPLFSILGQAQLLLRKYGDRDEDAVHRLKAIEESALRIACVTKKLANLAEPVLKEYVGLATSMIDVDRSTSK